MASPDKLAHIVFKTGQLTQMTEWYTHVLEGSVTFGNDFLAFITYDEEHHRVAFIASGATDKPEPHHSGLHHVAFTYATLGDLIGTYRRLAADDVRPFWCINHGPTTSMYFEDPDGNPVELQIENFATVSGASSASSTPESIRTRAPTSSTPVRWSCSGHGASPTRYCATQWIPC